ncbi:MAG: sodium:calcium antiporter [Candidatus Aenigmarchaeota archaeon]|nr:sodium:calcium antiporter [Candidatus Aenigmarchaeota archaeon]
MFHYYLQDPLFFNVLVLAASLYILYKSADLIVYGISDYAKKLGLSDAIIGLVVVAMAASAPEIISALTGFLEGNSSVGFGSILGANMVHVGFALGMLALVGKKVQLESTIFKKQKLFMWGVLMLPFLLSLDGVLSRVDGVLLIAAFAAYIGRLWHIEGTLGKLKKNVQLKRLWRDAFIFLGAFAALMLAGRWLVFTSINIASYFGLPSYFIALTVIGIGTTIPDMAIELRSLFTKKATIGLGDLLGSLMIELVLFFGILSILKPLIVDIKIVLNSLIFLSGSITVIMILMRGKEITRKHGLLLLGLYALFMLVEIYAIS